MLLQHIQCTTTTNDLDNSKPKLTLQQTESESESILARIGEIIDYIDNLYEKVENQKQNSDIDCKKAMEEAK
jgi:uncharacterized protein YkvS